MSEIEIRQAASADIPALRAMQERSLRALGRGCYPASQIDAFIAHIGTMDDYLVADRTYLLAALAGGIVGCGGWTTRLPGYARYAADDARLKEPGCATIRSVFVEPIAARQGIGRRIMDAVESFLRREGFHAAELGATENGRPFYQRLGYRPVCRFHVQLDDRIGMRFTRMRKVLMPANLDDSGPSLMSA